MLVVLSTDIAGFNYADVQSPNGWDLRFADDAETTELPYEIEFWNTSGKSYVWVKVPAIAGTTTRIWAYWGNWAATAQQAYTTNGAVWNSTFAGVWHLGADVKDSTSNHNDGVNSGTTNAAGLVGTARGFGGGTRIDVPDADSLDVTRLTEEVWFNTTYSELGYCRFIDKKYEAGYILGQVGGSGGRVGAWINGNTTQTSDTKVDGT